MIISIEEIGNHATRKEQPKPVCPEGFPKRWASFGLLRDFCAVYAIALSCLECGGCAGMASHLLAARQPSQLQPRTSLCSLISLTCTMKRTPSVTWLTCDRYRALDFCLLLLISPFCFDPVALPPISYRELAELYIEAISQAPFTFQ